jgi:hypothetical protein
MGDRIPQSTSYLLIFKAYLSSDHVTEATGKSIVITISKNGGAFGDLNAGASTTATAIASGWYKITLDTTDTATLGPLAVRGAVATIDDVGIPLFVVKATNWGLTSLPDTAVTTNASLLTSGTSTAQITAASGQVTIATNNDKTGYTANVNQIAGSTTGATNLSATTNAIGRGTVTTGGSTTSIPTSAFTPTGAVADQFKGRIILFDAATTTTELRGQVGAITASSNAATPTFTVAAMTTAPVSGDTFSVI